jgi:N-acetylmuramoyl-L-alanine amidase
MRLAGSLVLMLALMVFARDAHAAPPQPHGPAPLRIGGQDYIPLSAWAAAHSFDFRWLEPERALQITNRSARILMSVDHREMLLNGIEVWLLFPLALHNGGAYLSALDAQSTLQPILYPVKNRPGGKIRRICLDPGHGGKDPGNRVGSNEEKRFTLLLAQEVSAQLTKAGLLVTLTRTSDTFVDLPSRPDTARRRNADLFVSLHFNAADSGRDTVHGTEVYCLTPAGAESTNTRGEGGGTEACPGNRYNDRNLFLAYQVQRSLTRGLDIPDRGVRRARFAVLRDATMPATLIESGFMSHPVEGRKIFTADYRKKLARAIVDGLLAYKRAVEQGA